MGKTLATIGEKIKGRIEIAFGACIKPLIKLGEWLKRLRDAILGKLLIKLSSYTLEGYSQQLRIEERMKELGDSLPSEEGKEAKTLFDFISRSSKDDLEKIAILAETAKSIEEKDARAVFEFVSKFSKEDLEKIRSYVETPRSAKETPAVIPPSEFDIEMFEEKIKKMRELGLIDISDNDFLKTKNWLEQYEKLDTDETKKLEQIESILGISDLLTKDKLEIIEPSREGTPLNVVIKDRLAITELEKSIKKIEEQLKSALIVLPATYNRGIILLKEGSYKEACKCFDTILDLNESLKGAWLNKGVAFGGLGKIKREIACYEMALRIDKNYEKALNNKKIAERKWKELNKVKET